MPSHPMPARAASMPTFPLPQELGAGGVGLGQVADHGRV